MIKRVLYMGLIYFLYFFVLLLIGCERNDNNEILNLGYGKLSIPTVDISSLYSRHVIIEQGNDTNRQGHSSTILMPDNKTMFVIWTIGHGGPCGPLKKSVDGGLSWSDKIITPNNWQYHANCPPLYYLRDPEGYSRLFTFVSRGPYGKKMYFSYSEDNGNTWTPFEPLMIQGTLDTLSATIMPFTSIIPIENGGRLLAATNINDPYDKSGTTSVIAKSYSSDGGFTWSEWEVIFEKFSFFPAEPEIIRSPDGNQLLMITRENNREYSSWILLSNDEGMTWTVPVQAPESLKMDRHQACYSPDGRLVIAGRDVSEDSPSYSHLVAWVGTYEDLLEGNEGEYRIKLLHSHIGTAEYPGLEVLPDGTFIATSSVSYRRDENYSVVSTRFNLEEIDNFLKVK